MWTLWQAVRRVWVLLHSGLTPAQIALGFCLGLVAGLVPWGRNTVVWLLAAWVLDVSVGAALLGLALGKLLAWPLLPASVAVGRVLLDAEALEPLWRGLAYAPGLVWLELWRYAVLGGYALALALSVPAFFGVKALVQGYRARVGPRLQPRSRVARVALRLLLGGAPAAPAPAHPRARARARSSWRVVRVPALVALLIAALLGAGVVARVAPPLVQGALARGASWVVGGEVRVEGVEASALTGRLRVGTLEVQNPNKPEEDVLRVRSVALDVGVLPLLMSRRLVFDEIAVGEVELHVKRQRDGSLNLDDPIEADPDWRSYFEWLRANAERIDWLELWRRYGERYGRWVWARLKRALLERLAPAAVAAAEPLKALKPLEPPWPVVALERLRVERLQLKLTDEFAVTHAEELPPLTTVDVELEDVAWPSGLNDEPVKLRLRAENIDLKAYWVLYARTLPVRVERGRASVAVELNVLNGQGVRLQGRAQLVIVGLRLGLPDAGAQPPSLFGLGPEASRRVVEGINAYAQRCPIAIEFAIGGTTRRPELGWDEAFLKVAKRGLLMLGPLPFAPVLSQIEAKLRASEAQEQEGLQDALEGWLKEQLGLLGADAVGADECALERER